MAWDDYQKVCRFLATLTARKLEVPIATIRATANLRNDWEQCVNYLQNFIKPIGTNPRTIASTRIDYPSTEVDALQLQNDQLDKKLPEIADRYYKPEEWNQLMRAGRHTEVIELCKKRKGFDNKTGQKF